MKSYVADPNRLRGNAAEMRMLAGGATDITVRRLMCRLADGWEKLADRAERRAAQSDSISETPRCYNVGRKADIATSLGVHPKRERNSRLKCEISEKPTCNATSQIRTSLLACAVRSANACFSRTSAR